MRCGSSEIQADAVRSPEILDESIVLADLAPGARTALDAPRLRADETEPGLQSVSTCSSLQACSNVMAVHLPSGRWLVQATLTVLGVFPNTAPPAASSRATPRSSTRRCTSAKARRTSPRPGADPDQRADRIDRRRDHGARRRLHHRRRALPRVGRGPSTSPGRTASSPRSRSRTRRRRTRTRRRGAAGLSNAPRTSSSVGTSVPLWRCSELDSPSRRRSRVRDELEELRHRTPHVQSSASEPTWRGKWIAEQ